MKKSMNTFKSLSTYYKLLFKTLLSLFHPEFKVLVALFSLSVYENVAGLMEELYLGVNLYFF